MVLTALNSKPDDGRQAAPDDPHWAPEARVSSTQCWRGPRHHFAEIVNNQVGAQAAPPPLRLVENGPSLDIGF